MYLIDLALKLSPFPLSVQRKKLEDAQQLYNFLKKAVQTGEPKLLEINCEQSEEKKIAVLASEVLAVQMYEKTVGGSGSKRPGFSFDS